VREFSSAIQMNCAIPDFLVSLTTSRAEKDRNVSCTIFPQVLQPAPHQVIANIPEGVRLPTTRPTRPPPPLIPSSKTSVPSEKPSFIMGGSISQVRELLFENLCLHQFFSLSPIFNILCSVM